jgi:hypothetical protein
MFQMAVHSFMEVNPKQLKYAVSRGDECDVNFLQLVQSIDRPWDTDVMRFAFQLSHSHPHHLMHHAIQLKHYNMVDTLIKAGANVNTQCYIKEYYYVREC